MTTIENAWILLPELRRGVAVRRAFAGIYPLVSRPNEQGLSEVLQCPVFYYDEELYPNGEVISSVMKSYTLVDLPEDVNDADGYRMAARAVLTGFIQLFGKQNIVEPARLTLADITTLMLGAPDGYPLHRDTREKLPL